MKLISIVVPLYNEQDSIKELYERVKTTFRNELPSFEWELLFINDGSSDDSLTVLKNISDHDPHVGVVSFTRNFGQHPGLFAGLRYARGDYVVFMDADLQNPPEEIPKLVHKIISGYDIVYGERKDRKDSLIRRLGGRFFAFMVRFFLKISDKDVGAAFRIISRKVVDEFIKVHEQTRHPVILMTWMGYKSASVETRHDYRQAGESKYSLWKTVKMAAELVMGFSPQVLRLITVFGFFTAGIAFLVGTYFLFLKFFYQHILPGFTSIMVLITFFFGMTFVFLGIISEYIAKIFQASLKRPFYVIDSLYGNLKNLSSTKEYHAKTVLEQKSGYYGIVRASKSSSKEIQE